MVANRQERGYGRQHRARSRVDRISGRTNGRGKRTKSGSNTYVVPVSCSCRTNIVLAVLDRQRSGAKATISWFCHDHDRSGRSAMIGNIGKEWSAQCDLGLSNNSTMPRGRSLCETENGACLKYVNELNQIKNLSDIYGLLNYTKESTS